MARGISLRTLLLVSALVVGMAVLVISIRGVPSGIRAAGVELDPSESEQLVRSIAATEFVRGLVVLAFALLVVWLIAESASAFFERLRAGEPAPPGAPWLLEARDMAERVDRLEKEQAWRSETVTRQRAELDRLVEGVSEGILQLDAAGRVMRANRAARRLLAMPDDTMGRPIASVVRSAELRALLQQAAGEDGLPPREITFEERTLIVSVRRLPGATGASPDAPAQAPGLAVAIADLTALRRLESVRRDFVANASHELKTPLTSIRGYAETLLDDSLPEETRRQFIATISSNAYRLERIVDDLLDLSRLDSGTWQADVVRVDAAAALREAWTDFADRAHAAGVAFDVQAEPGLHVLADASGLRQVFSNLFDNALRYTSAGGVIACSARKLPVGPGTAADDAARSMAAIEVRDTGSGIPTDALPRIFERFYRADPARSRAAGGTGLGLAIVKHLVESMAGRVEAESILGEGTTIRVVLPVAASESGTPAGGAGDVPDA